MISSYDYALTRLKIRQTYELGKTHTASELEARWLAWDRSWRAHIRHARSLFERSKTWAKRVWRVRSPKLLHAGPAGTDAGSSLKQPGSSAALWLRHARSIQALPHNAIPNGEGSDPSVFAGWLSSRTLVYCNLQNTVRTFTLLHSAAGLVCAFRRTCILLPDEHVATDFTIDSHQQRPSPSASTKGQGTTAASETARVPCR